jgi:hypothetical protein
MEHSEIQIERYFVLLVLALVLNLSAAAYSPISAQTIVQKTITVDVIVQPDCPVSINVLAIDNSNTNAQQVSVALQNVGTKSISGFVLTQRDSNKSEITSTSYLPRLFAPSQVMNQFIVIDNRNVRPDGKNELSVDYVRFVDGSSWGDDTAGQSERISGYLAGYRSGISFANSIIKNDEDALTHLLREEITNVNPPSVDQSKPGLWRGGFVIGYRTVISRLQRTFEEKGINAVAGKLEEIGKSNH